MEVKVDSLLKFCTLFILGSKPTHGYGLIKQLEEKLERRVSTSNVYPFLEELVKSGYLKIREGKVREKKIYSLSQKGKGLLDKVLERTSDVIDFAVKSKISVCAHCGCEVYRGAHIEKVRGKRMVFCCPHCAKAFRGK